MVMVMVVMMMSSGDGDGDGVGNGEKSAPLIPMKKGLVDQPVPCGPWRQEVGGSSMSVGPCCGLHQRVNIPEIQQRCPPGAAALRARAGRAGSIPDRFARLTC